MKIWLKNKSNPKYWYSKYQLRACSQIGCTCACISTLYCRYPPRWYISFFSLLLRRMWLLASSIFVFSLYLCGLCISFICIGYCNITFLSCFFSIHFSYHVIGIPYFFVVSLARLCLCDFYLPCFACFFSISFNWYFWPYLSFAWAQCPIHHHSPNSFHFFFSLTPPLSFVGIHCCIPSIITNKSNNV